MGWSDPLTIFSGIIALLCLAWSISLTTQHHLEIHHEKLLLMLTVGGLTAAALYGLLLITRIFVFLVEIATRA